MNPYMVLGVSNSATVEECKRAYRKLVVSHHPDKGGNVNKFHEIVEAYETITNGTRATYTVKPKRNKVVHVDLFNFRVVCY